MDPNLRRLGVGAGLRSFGLTFVGPFAALYLYRVAHLGFLAIGLLLAAISVPPLLWSPFAGALADRLGRRRILLFGLYGESASMALVAAGVREGSILLFVGGFAVSGMLATTGMPALSAYVADLAEGSDRTLGFTWIRVGTNVGFSAGVLAGGIVVGSLGFLAGALAACLLVAGGATLLLLTLDPSPYDRTLRVGASAGGAPAPSGFRRLGAIRRDRRFLLAATAFGLATLVTAQWGTTYALFASEGLGLSYATIGVGFALNGLLVVVGQAATTRSVLGRRHTSIGIYGTLCYVAGFLLLGVAGVVRLEILGLFLAATAVITLGENLITIPTSTLPSNLAPPEAIGAYNGAFGTILGFGGLLATAVGGAALGAVSDPLLLWLVLVVPAVPACLLLARVGTWLPDRRNRA